MVKVSAFKVEDRGRWQTQLQAKLSLFTFKPFLKGSLSNNHSFPHQNLFFVLCGAIHMQNKGIISRMNSLGSQTHMNKT